MKNISNALLNFQKEVGAITKGSTKFIRIYAKE